MDRDETERLLRLIIEAGASRGLREKDILSRAGLGKTTLSKIKKAGDTKISNAIPSGEGRGTAFDAGPQQSDPGSAVEPRVVFKQTIRPSMTGQRSE